MAPTDTELIINIKASDMDVAPVYEWGDIDENKGVVISAKGKLGKLEGRKNPATKEFDRLVEGEAFLKGHDECGKLEKKEYCKKNLWDPLVQKEWKFYMDFDNDKGNKLYIECTDFDVLYENSLKSRINRMKKKRKSVVNPPGDSPSLVHIDIDSPGCSEGSSLGAGGGTRMKKQRKSVAKSPNSIDDLGPVTRLEFEALKGKVQQQDLEIKALKQQRDLHYHEIEALKLRIAAISSPVGPR